MSALPPKADIGTDLNHLPRNSSDSLAIFAAIRRGWGSFEVKVYADNAASALCIQLKTFSYTVEGADVWN